MDPQIASLCTGQLSPVDADGPHPVSAAEALALALGELRAAQPPRYQVVAPSELVVGLVTCAATVSTS